MKVMVIISTPAFVPKKTLRAIIAQDYADTVTIINTMKPFIPYGGKKNEQINLARNRNFARTMALASDAEWFLFLDPTVVLPKDAITNFLTANQPIMGGWFLSKHELSGVAESLKDGVVDFYVEEKPGVIPVVSAHLSCAMIHRSVLEKIEFRVETGTPLQLADGGVHFMDDNLTFALDAKKAGFASSMVGGVICSRASLTS